MRSRHPAARVRNDTTHRADGSRQGQQIHVRHTEGQTQRAVPGTSSLAHVARIGTWSAGGPAFSRQALAAMHHEVGLISCPRDQRTHLLDFFRFKRRVMGGNVGPELGGPHRLRLVGRLIMSLRQPGSRSTSVAASGR